MCLKMLLSSYTMFWTHNISWNKFSSLFLNIVKGIRGEKQKIVQIAVFPIIFVTDCIFSHFFRVITSTQQSRHTMSSEQILFFWRVTFSKHYLIRSSCFFKINLIILESNIPHCLLFLKSNLFRATTLSKDLTLHSSQLFRKATFHNIFFQKRYHFTVTLPFPQINFLFIG